MGSLIERGYLGVEFIGRGWNRYLRSLRITEAERRACISDEGLQWDNLD